MGNCIYDKDYLAKVTRIKVAPVCQNESFFKGPTSVHANGVQSKWDAENLHRHPDYAPTKKEPVRETKLQEDLELPPQPIEYTNRREATSHETSVTIDGDGEFGSKNYRDYVLWICR